MSIANLITENEVVTQLPEKGAKQENDVWIRNF